jgi:predicted DNA-binding transcriptional regulator AlpA
MMAFHPLAPLALLSLTQVVERTGLMHGIICQLEALHCFPPHVRNRCGTKAWSEEDIVVMMAEVGEG